MVNRGRFTYHATSCQATSNFEIRDHIVKRRNLTIKFLKVKPTATLRALFF